MEKEEIFKDNLELYEGVEHTKYKDELANITIIDIIYDCFLIKHQILQPI